MKLIYALLLAFGLSQTEAKSTLIIKEYYFAQDYEIANKYAPYLLACCMVDLKKEYALLITGKEFSYVSKDFKMLAAIRDNKISFLFRGEPEDIDCFLIDFESILD